MSLLEGFSDWVMDEVGAQVVPNVRPDPPALRAAPRAAPARPRLGHRAPDRARPQARAVPARRAVRERRGGRRRPRRRVACCGRGRGRCLPSASWPHPAEWVARVAPHTLLSRSLMPGRRRARTRPDDGSRGQTSVGQRGAGDRRAARHRAVAHPVGALPPARPDAIAAASPGSRLVSVSLEGLADGDLSDVEVLLRGPLPTLVFDRLLSRCPRLRWVHSATAGVERVLTPAAHRARAAHHQRPWRLLRRRSPSTC